MRTVSVSDAKNNLSALLREIRGGRTVIITDRGTPVARLSAVPRVRGVPAAAIELAQRGRLRLPDSAPSLDWLDAPRIAPVGGQSAVAALLEERASNR